jgi:hypothetical protein
MKKTVYGFIIAVSILLAGCDHVTDSSTPGNEHTDKFVAVTDISGVPSGGVSGVEIDLSGAAVEPDNATNKVIEWTVTDVGGTGITSFTDGKATPAAAGTLALTATVANGATANTPFTKAFTITVVDAENFVAVTGITGIPATGIVGEGIDLSGAVVAPDNATNQTIVWTASGAGLSQGTVTSPVMPTAAGELTLTATIAHGLAAGTQNYTQNFTVTVGSLDLSGVTLNTVVAVDGQASDFAPTTKVTLTFSQDVPGLTVEHITFEAEFARVAKGTLTKAPGTGVYALVVDALAEENEGVEFAVRVSDGENDLSNSVTLYTWIEVADATALAAIGNSLPLEGWYKQTEDITIANPWTPIANSYDWPFTGVYDGGNKVITPDAVTSTEDLGVFGLVDGATFKNMHIGEGSMTTTGNNIGGIALGTGEDGTTTFTHCSNAATLSGVNVGGIISAGGNCIIQDCWNTDTIISTGDDQVGVAGGIAVQLSGGSINHCYNSGTISTTSLPGVAGGIVGVAASDADTPPVIQNCYNTGTITGSVVGGICGELWIDAMIIACYNAGTVTGIEEAAGEVTGAGGIAGTLIDASDGVPAIIACYNKGVVRSTVATSSEYAIHIGGITGNNFSNYGAITASYSVGTLSHTGDTSQPGAVYIGGISGLNGYETDDTATVTACFWATGKGASNGIGAMEEVAEDESPDPSDEGAVAFSGSAWPTASTHAEWGTGDGSGSGQYWKSLGSWNNGVPVYPKLWFED